MKNLTQIILVSFCLCLPAPMQAQKNDDSRYLEGAVPEVDGKVVFTQEFSIPGMTKEEIYDRMLAWMEADLKKNENNSRVLYSNPETGQIVGLGEEWIVFKSTALSLDRTEIQYQLTATCEPGKCVFEVEKIRFEYREGEEKYTAEKWITDKYALNKNKTKLVRGLAKWRRKTVDFVDGLNLEVTQALSATPADAADQAVAQKDEGIKKSSSGTVVINLEQKPKAVPVTTPGDRIPAKEFYKEVAPDQLSADLIQMGGGKLVIAIGTDNSNMTTLTANAGGSLGKLSGKPVVYTFLSPDQPHEQLDQAETYSVRFYPNGQKEPSVILECRKLPSQEPLEGQPRMYIGEIVKALTK